ncbi:Calx-beta domain-containing protein [Paludisphaera soli]|uniref:Calx-beta domain-containing protein n=1 Tax=Paludisphaera soli TaxID=2712865 RepID=UPI0013EB2EEF|nr:Calx-beta domain-containing protein [Paludisphaera soli]
MRLPLGLQGRSRRAAGRRAGTPRLECVERRILPATFLVETTADDGPGSLRWALSQADADEDAGPSLIRFAIPGEGLRTIRLESPLAPITRPVLIEGRSQPGYQGSPLIRLDGSHAGAGAGPVDGLVVAGGRSVVAGLVITGFSGAGIVLTGGGGDFVESSYVGLVPGEATASGNGVGVLVVGSSFHTIGGPGAQGNVISGNRGAGVRVQAVEAGDAANVSILGNRIGTDGLGGSAIGNGSDGVTFVGATAGRIAGNLISGNLGNGVALTGRSNGTFVLGNVLGLTADATAVLGNFRDGVLVDDSGDVRIGGLTPGEGNQIGGNRGSGVNARNDAGGLKIQGNLIGSDATGTRRLGNLQDGVTLRSSGATVGGADSGAGNLIAYNGGGTTGAGVQLVGLARHNAILSNRIFGNSGLGINLGNGPTPNHTPGESAGPNDWINYPLLTSASTDGVRTGGAGILIGEASKSYTIQFFWSREVDRSGFGEGERLLGSIAATADASGRASFTAPFVGSAEGGFLSATATDAAGNTSEFSQSILVRPQTDLSVAMVASPSHAPQGSPVTFTATVTNRGHLVANGVNLTARFPASSMILSAQSSQGVVLTGSASGPDSNVGLSIGSLAPGATAVLTVVVQAPPSFAGDLTGTATATMSEADSRPGDESASASARLTVVADLALALTAGPTSASRGDSMTYVLTASNAGPGTAADAVLTLPIGDGATFLGASGSQGTGSFAAGRLVVSLGALAPGGVATISVELRADAQGLYTTTASLASSAFDPDLGDLSATLSTLVAGRADLKLAMQAPAAAADGAEATYVVMVTNSGPDDARNVVVLDLIPSQSTLVSAAIDGGSASFANGVVTGRLDRLASGATAALRIVVRPSAALGSVLTNAARVSSDDFDADLRDNSAWRETVVRPASDLGVTIEPPSAAILRGRSASFRVRVANAGPTAEPNALLTVAPPAGATASAAPGWRGPAPTTADGLLTFRLGSLAVGASVEVEIVLTPGASLVGPIELAATVRGDNADPGPSDDAAVAIATVEPAADLAVYVAPPRFAYERTAFSYTLTAANLSPWATGGVRLAAPLPAGVEFVSAVASRGPTPVLGAGGVVAFFGELAGSSTATMTITVRPTTTAGAVLLLSGAATSDLPDPRTGNDVGRYAVTVAPAVDLSLRLRPLQPAVELGGEVTWVAEVWNASLTTATGVVLDIPYPAGGTYVGAATTQGSIQASADRIAVALGTLAPRGSATFAFVLRPRTFGDATLTAIVAADQFDSNPDDARATARVTIVEPPGTFRFASAEVVAAEDAGVAHVAVERVGGARGTVTVAYRTTSGDASPGIDYRPVSGVLTFQPGQTIASIPVPVLPYAHNRGDKSVGIVLESPTAGATLAGPTSARIVIRDLDSDLTPPSVDRIRLLGDPSSIVGLAIAFNEPLKPEAALDGAAYTLYDLGPGGVFGDGDDAPIAYKAPGYDPATRNVYFTPTVPLAPGRHYAIVVRGAGRSAVTDAAGNALGGGVDFVGLFARGATLKYTDSNGDAVSLQAQNGGYLDLVRSAAGEAKLLTLQGAVRGRTTLSGTVTKPRVGGDGVTAIDAIEGLGSFGDVRVSMKSPPFLTRGLPVAVPRNVRPTLAPQFRRR